MSVSHLYKNHVQVCGMNPDLAAKVTAFVLGRFGDKKRVDEPLEPAESLTLVVANWLQNVMGLREHNIVMLLCELQDMFCEIAPVMDKLWRECDTQAPVPANELLFAEGLWATWTGNDKFYSLTGEGDYVDRLPRNPRWRSSLHLAGLYFSWLELGQIAAQEVSKDVDQTTQATGAVG